MSNSPTTPNPTDIGLATGPAPTPAMPSTVNPNTPAIPNAPAATDQPNPAAAASQTGVQPPAQQPPHITRAQKVYDGAIAMTGGPHMTTTYNDDGSVTRTPAKPSMASLGLSLAMQILSGGMKGGAS